jgi:hypothetical protein
MGSTKPQHVNRSGTHTLLNASFELKLFICNYCFIKFCKQNQFNSPILPKSLENVEQRAKLVDHIDKKFIRNFEFIGVNK